MTAIEKRCEKCADSDFWATVARDEHGFVRTQEEWDKVTAYVREQAAKVQVLEGALREPTEAMIDAAITTYNEPSDPTVFGWRDSLVRALRAAGRAFLDSKEEGQ